MLKISQKIISLKDPIFMKEKRNLLKYSGILFWVLGVGGDLVSCGLVDLVLRIDSHINDKFGKR
jgi:hypothetical protein